MTCPRCARLEALLKLVLKDGLRHDRTLWREIHDTLSARVPPNHAGNAPSCPESTPAYTESPVGQTQAENGLGFTPGMWPEQLREITAAFSRLRRVFACQEARILRLEEALRFVLAEEEYHLGAETLRRIYEVVQEAP